MKIAARALEYIPDGSTVALDIGTTTYELSALLGTKKNLTIITNSLRVATNMAQNTNHTVYCIGGLMTRVEIEAVVDVKRRLIQMSDRVISLVDHSKFGKRALFPTCALRDLDLLITDGKTEKSYLEQLSKAGVSMVIAE